jgi:hypothetical protein
MFRSAWMRRHTAELESMLASQRTNLEERNQLIFRIHAEAGSLRSQLERALLLSTIGAIRDRFTS